jgi:hypothetical protein
VVGIILNAGNLPGNEPFKNEIASFFPSLDLNLNFQQLLERNY